MKKRIYLVCEYSNGELEKILKNGKIVPSIIIFEDEDKAKKFMNEKNRNTSNTKYRLLVYLYDPETGLTDIEHFFWDNEDIIQKPNI